ncbi:MAG: NAD(P)H-hydrate epimerase, partial [Chlamydiae bacterium]|nr:NAD(P)H-hydrate epimerase [Chlamydiota bacterium]
MEQILPPFFETKVVSAPEMARLDQLAIKQGCSEEKFIEEAGRCVANKALELVQELDLPKRATLLIGKGNKGADTYAAGIHLIDEGFQVVAYTAFAKGVCSQSNKVFADRFMRKRGQLFSYEKGVHFEKGLLIDGLLGTGFQGKVDGHIASLIELANLSFLPILAVDVPSGLDGTTGEVKGPCIKAFATVTLGMAKSGLFLRKGWCHTGTLTVGDFGLPRSIQELAVGTAYLPDASKLPLPHIHRSR